MSREEKQRWLDALEDDILLMLERSLPLALSGFLLTYILARWVI